MWHGPGDDDDAFDNSGQAFEADVDSLYGTEDTDVDDDTQDQQTDED